MLIEVGRWIAAVALLGLCLFLTAMNDYIIFMAIVLRRGIGSWGPLLGGLSGAAGLLLLPVPGTDKYWWVPPIADLGCVFGVGYNLVAHAIHAARRSDSLDRPSDSHPES